VESPVADGGPVALAGSHVEKRLGHVQALVDASISVHGRKIVALFGDNDAGKVNAAPNQSR
jgi:ABC-type sugar transport system ATPase subunit